MFKSSNDEKLDREIADSLEQLATLRDDPDKYAAVLERIVKLDKLKSEGFQPPSLDTVLLVGANIFGILWVARYERENVIKAPNAFKFIMKPR
jgi:hypothetical protein